MKHTFRLVLVIMALVAFFWGVFSGDIAFGAILAVVCGGLAALYYPDDRKARSEAHHDEER